jgi:hypothetical protein
MPEVILMPDEREQAGGAGPINLPFDCTRPSQSDSSPGHFKSGRMAKFTSCNRMSQKDG